jgi:hypothetical protein
MYKTRIHHWGLHKYDKKKELDRAFPATEQHTSSGPGQSGSSASNAPDSNDTPSLQRRDLTVHYRTSTTNAQPAPPQAHKANQLQSPSAVRRLLRHSRRIRVHRSPPILHSVRSPTEVSSQNLLRSIEIYHKQRFQLKNWTLATTSDEDDEALYPSMKFANLLLEYNNLLTLKRREAAFATLSDAFEMIQTLLQVRDPRLFIYIMESIAYCYSIDRKELAHQAIHFFGAMATHVVPDLGPSHPITMFFSSLLHNRFDDIATLLEVGLQCLLGAFTMHLGPQHYETVRIMLTGSTILKHMGHYGRAMDFIDRLIDLYGPLYGDKSYQSCHALVDKAYLEMLMGLRHKGEEHAMLSLANANGIGEVVGRTESQMRCLMFLARLRKSEGDGEGMRHHVDTALEVGGQVLDGEHWMMKDALAELTAADGVE